MQDSVSAQRRRPTLAEYGPFLLVAGVALVAGLAYLLPGIAEYQAARASNRWPSVQGSIVISREIDTGGFKGTEHDIVYTYTVGETEYQGRRVLFGRTNLLPWEVIAD
jgi:hypothetical protein